MTIRLLNLKNRAVLRLTGSETINFLNGLVTNDIAKTKDGPLYAALLTPQGKFLFDMIAVADGDDILLDVEAARKDALIQRLTMYKLRSDVEIKEENASVWAVWAETDTDLEALSGTVYHDPRHKALKYRVISEREPVTSFVALSEADYNERRIRHGVPDGSSDMLVDKYFWLETNAEKLNGVSFTKGCYVGQELTARMKHRTTLKKSLMPVELLGDAKPGDTVETEEGKDVGILHTVANGFAMAFMRFEYLNKPLYISGSDTKVTPRHKKEDEDKEE